MISIKEEIIPYLKGEKFSNGLDLTITEKFEDNRRIDLITKLSVNKKIIHIGCVDHIPLIKEKLSNNTWLHSLITEVADKVIGVDISQEGINYIKNEIGVANVVCADITTDSIPELEGEQWDYMILGEIIEHVDNPIQFLNSILKKYKGIVNKIYITAPNIMVRNRFEHMINTSSELINTDHRFWFTPFTLAKVMTLAGFNNIKLDFADRVTLNKAELVSRKLKTMSNQKSEYPFYYFNSVVGIAKF